MRPFPTFFKDSNRTWTEADGTAVPLKELTSEDRAEIEQLLIDNADLVRAAHRRDLVANATRNGWSDKVLANILFLFDKQSAFEVESSKLMKRLRKLDSLDKPIEVINGTTGHMAENRRSAAYGRSISDQPSIKQPEDPR